MKPMIIVQPGQGGGNCFPPPKSNWMQAASTSPPVAGPGSDNSASGTLMTVQMHKYNYV